MTGPEINVVWLKRDLRLRDHEPLLRAVEAGLPCMVLFLFEPSLIARPDTSLRHLQFQYHSVLSMNHALLGYGWRVEMAYADAEEMFSTLLSRFRVRQVFSHQESGTQATWDRDKRVAATLSQQGVVWRECQRDGVVRGIRNRNGWDQEWYATMNALPFQNRYPPELAFAWEHPFPLEEAFEFALREYPASYQPPGEANAWRYLRSFVKERGFLYNRLISKPAASRQSCSRISPYLSWGNLSIRQALQFVRSHPNYPGHKRAFDGFLTRLKWHCHFIQKFEVECAYESECINRGYESLERPLRRDFVEAWEQGRTGFPLVDACMRCLQETGWVNFRMRAMLVSFLCHHLDQDWREGVYHVARLFLDYEPGIHYPQFQMQAGTTGVNTVRMYNPVKQSQDHDPDGAFVKRWVPELANLPDWHRHEPWKMTEMEQEFCGVVIGRDYPAPLVDLVESGRAARAKIWGHRADPLVRAEKKRIVATHVRKSKPWKKKK